MIKTTLYTTREDGVRLVRSYSDEGMIIQNQDGVRYSEAIDPETVSRTYTETAEPIPDAMRLTRRVESLEKAMLSKF